MMAGGLMPDPWIYLSLFGQETNPATAYGVQRQATGGGVHLHTHTHARTHPHIHTLAQNTQKAGVNKR